MTREMRSQAFLDAAIGRKVQLQGPASLLTGRFLQYSLGGRLSRPQSQSGDCNEEYLVTLMRIEPQSSYQDLGILNDINCLFLYRNEIFCGFNRILCTHQNTLSITQSVFCLCEISQFLLPLSPLTIACTRLYVLSLWHDGSDFIN